MKKKISMLAAALVLTAGFGISNISVSDAKVLPIGYKQGKKTIDNNCNEVFVCPHSDGSTNCV
jgi:hypothetical protein